MRNGGRVARPDPARILAQRVLANLYDELHEARGAVAGVPRRRVVTNLRRVMNEERRRLTVDVPALAAATPAIRAAARAEQRSRQEELTRAHDGVQTDPDRCTLYLGDRFCRGRRVRDSDRCWRHQLPVADPAGMVAAYAETLSRMRGKAPEREKCPRCGLLLPHRVRADDCARCMVRDIRAGEEAARGLGNGGGRRLTPPIQQNLSAYRTAPLALRSRSVGDSDKTC